MWNRTAPWVLAGVLLLLAACPASAGQPRTHDGFFLRLSMGMGTANAELESEGVRMELSGTSNDINIAIGGIVSRNLALHGTLWGWFITDPRAEVSAFGETVTGDIKGDMDLTAIGAGLTWYVGPNLYASASAGTGTLSFDGDMDGESKDGFVADLTLGKEWWVGSSWGLGFAVGGGYHSLPEKGVSASWKGYSVVGRLSATFN